MEQVKSTNEDTDRSFWHLSVEQVAERLGSDAVSGLSNAEADRRLSMHGPNSLAEKEGEGRFRLFLRQFESVIIWVLIAAAVICGFLGEAVDSVVIVAIVLLNAALGFIQEYRAEKALAALRRMASPSSRVVRGGQRGVVVSEELVPGDLVELEAGDNVPADCRVTWHTSNFAVQEASLTGESQPVSKHSKALEPGDVPLADRVNMVFMGTSVVAGKARAMTALTGMKTELGLIAGMLQDIESEPTPLQRKLDEFGRLIVKICVSLVCVIFLLQWMRGGSVMETFLTAVSLAVAAIPEGLPAVVTVALALGVQRMVKRHALIRKLPSVETLGCATVICSDKTGTLTKNEMTVQAVYADGKVFRVSGTGYEPTGEFLLGDARIAPDDHCGLMRGLLCGVLCNGAALSEKDGRHSIVGDPTEAALLTCAAKAGLLKDKLESEYRQVEEIPFDSDRKMMTILRRTPDGTHTAFVKGAPDIMLAHCGWLEENGEVRRLDQADRDRILRANGEFADRAMRVLGVAYRTLPVPLPAIEARTVETDMVFVALTAMIDPPRPEAAEAVARCRAAGIKPVMITGDHRSTAVAIAGQLGLHEPGSAALTAQDLDEMSDERLFAEVEDISVYARVSPEHKLRVVRALRRRNHVVAMTGDGVNDAPAVKEADIGVAMGITGTDVTKEVSDMIVTDDNFASIVSAVEEGRGIYDNILKFVHYLLSCNAGEVLTMFIASLFGMPNPLVPVQILWVNLVTDGFPALALGMDPIDRDIMTRKPRDPMEPVVDRLRGAVMTLQGLFIAVCTLAGFWLVYERENGDIIAARTAAFVILSCSQLFHAFNCRSATESIFKLGLFTNMKLVYAVLISFTLQVGVVTLPFLQGVFKVETLPLADWLIVVAFASFPLWAMELVKLVLRARRAP